MAKLKLDQCEIDLMDVAYRFVAEPSVYGVGVNDVGFIVGIGGKPVWQYDLWKGMLRRCFDRKYNQVFPTYKDVTCCEEWLSFGCFLEWVNKEVDYKGKPTGFHLDKDVMVRGNKCYSPQTCCFVPPAVNSLLIDRCNFRGKWPVGVVFHKGVGKFVATVGCNGKINHLGYFDNPENAFGVYKAAKEAQVKFVATRYKDVLKPAVYESLMKWEVQR